MCSDAGIGSSGEGDVGLYLHPVVDVGLMGYSMS
jgi:hypothetical protein